MLELHETTDVRLMQDVLNELHWDTRVDASQISVDVDAGVVKLTGTVGSYAQKIGARDAAHRVRGVLDVADDIRVVIPGTILRTDAQIAHAVRTALEMDALVPHAHITSTVSDGWVTLDGDVDFWHQFDDAERVVRYLDGVVGITNRIKVKASRVTPEQVRASIEEAITRQSDTIAQGIKVAVRDGVVTLAGKVRSRREKQVIVEAVKHAPGVGTLEDLLIIDPLA